jgi:hypothetical protein
MGNPDIDIIAQILVHGSPAINNRGSEGPEMIFHGRMQFQGTQVRIVVKSACILCRQERE